MSETFPTTFVDHSSIAVGDAVPALERTIGLTDMVAYAGATWDWHKLHYDTAYVAEKKLPGPIVDGQVYGALLVEQLQDWLGPQSFVHELEFTFRNLVFAGETLRCQGTVTEVAADRVSVELSVVVVAEDGTDSRAAAAPCRAVVLLGRPDGPGAS
ncbi:MaoC/PaaZ C-terminal domain-containing protein [Nocardioides sp. W7]|uniref:MaoC family dehydratase n=1 Tax=Nocardioides sp. W7 TaxID=2931390 RepID=UPI001FD19551|nr:MaoC/PaaZ C-terminal domain-containing protein [Nocardioides sp. W7]